MKNRVKFYVRTRNTTIRILAKEIGVNPSTLSYWINNDCIPDYGFKRIGDVLKISIEDLKGE